jgi:hypothetical protein
MPVTAPLVTIATSVLSLLHSPPLVADDNVIVEPTHNTVPPVIGAGNALTVILRVVIQPSQLVNVIVQTPAATPVIVVIEPTSITVGILLTVATAVLLLLHVPQPASVDHVVVEPTHTDDAPDGVDGTGYTFISIVVSHAVAPAAVNVIMALPSDTPETTPDVIPTVATSVLLLVHDTPVVLPLKVVVLPKQILGEPVIPGVALTETTIVATAVPQEVVTE